MTKDLLKEQNDRIHAEALNTKARLDAERSKKQFHKASEYPFFIIQALIATKLGLKPSELDLSWVDSKKFKADLALRVPGLLKSKPTPEYIKSEVPRMAEALKPLIAEGVFSAVQTTGIYVNVTLNDSWLFNTIGTALSLGDGFGEQDSLYEHAYVVDYSSPNVAKHLHAGHVRSTIIGHVLANLYQSSGARTYRLNYLNDWGGFGELIEGCERWTAIVPEGLSGNDLLAQIYSIYRTAEQACESEEAFLKLSPDSKTLLMKAFKGATTFEALQNSYQEFKEKAREVFAALERGAEKETKAWQQICEWSIRDFKKFYSLLGVVQDFQFGESFFSRSGREAIQAGLKSGVAIQFTKDRADKEILKLKEEFSTEKITEAEFQAAKAEIEADIDAYLVPLSNGRRMVVQRKDGASIYATRDISSLQYRVKNFEATDLIYEVGQEQGEHFQNLFEASKLLGSFGGKEVRCSHIYHGFYVDAATKKKLSSRQGASSVLELFTSAIQYFLERYKDSTDFSDAEKKDIAEKIAIGSVVYNDLRRDKKLPVEMHADKRIMFEEFEKSGGAYVIYTACRARSVVKKAGGLPDFSKVPFAALEPIERELLKALMEFPAKVITAAKTDNPAALISFVETLAATYNSFYHELPVIKGGVRNEHRIVLSHAAGQAIINGLRICHVFCPERI
jgi:arginyl-tRNA synthetase